MAGTRTLKVTVIGDSRSAQKALGALDSPVNRVAKSMASAGRTMSLGFTLPAIAAGKVAVDEFSEVVQVTEQTNAALESTGGVANVTAGHVEGLAARLGDLAQVDAEVVHAAENVLLTFTNVRNEVGKGNDVFDRATKAALDLSSRMGTDLSSAMLQVGKATNDPIKGVSMLGRAGVQFSEDQKFMIASLQESGDLLGAQKIVLDELERQFGGSAKAAGEARSPIEKLGLQFRDIAETAGQFLVPMLEKVGDWLGTVADGFKNLPSSVQGGIVAFTAFLAVLGPILVIAPKIVTAMRVIGSALGVLIAGPLGAVTLGIAALAGAMIAISPEALSFGSHLDHLIDKVDGVNEEFKKFMSLPGDAIAGAFERAGDGAVAFAEQTVTTKEKLAGFTSLTKEGMRNWKDEVSGSLDIVSGTLGALAEKAHLTVDKILNAFRKKLDAVSEFGKNIKTLAEKGLSEFAAMTLAKMGEAGAYIAATMVDGTRRDVSQFNRLLKNAEGAAGQFSGSVRSAFGSASGAANGLISSLQGIIDKLNALNALGVPAVLSNQLINSGGAGIPSGGGGGSGGSGGGSGGGSLPPNIPDPRGRTQTTSLILEGKTIWQSSSGYAQHRKILLAGK